MWRKSDETPPLREEAILAALREHETIVVHANDETLVHARRLHAVNVSPGTGPDRLWHRLTLK